MRTHNGRLPKQRIARTIRYRRNSDPVQQRIACAWGAWIDNPGTKYWHYPNSRTATVYAKSKLKNEREG